MSSTSPTPSGARKIIEIMRASIMPALEGGAANIVPLGAPALPSAAGFEEVFPYGFQHHPSFEWMWPVGGWTHIKIDKAVYLLSPGDFCLIAPGMKHAEVYSAATPVHQSLWCSYAAHTGRITANIFVYDSVGHGTVTHGASAQVPPLFSTLLVALQNEIAARQDGAEAVCRGLLMTLANLILRHLEKSLAQPAGVDTAGMVSRQAVDFLRLHYAENIALDDVAREVHLSRNYLATVFKRETGKTIVNALTEIRLEHAKHLLVEGRHPVRDVAAAVGFRSPEHFCRIFQRYENIAPSVYGK